MFRVGVDKDEMRCIFEFSRTHQHDFYLQKNSIVFHVAMTVMCTSDYRPDGTKRKEKQTKSQDGRRFASYRVCCRSDSDEISKKNEMKKSGIVVHAN